jgi:protein tyrosine phosphatase
MRTILDAPPRIYNSQNGWQDVEKFNLTMKFVGPYRLIKKEKCFQGLEYLVKCIQEFIAFITFEAIGTRPEKKYFSNKVTVKLGIPYLKKPIDQIFNQLNIPSLPTGESYSLELLQKLFRELNICSSKLGEELPQNYYFDPKISRVNHRFSNIHCPRDTSIRLDGMHEDFFIHANQISIDNFYAIATQYPLVQNDNWYWFWMMASRKGSVIIDLTNESDLKQENMPRYYPSNKDQNLEIDDLMIEFDQNQDIEGMNNARLCRYKITDKGQTTFIDQIQMKCWPDGKAINVDSIIQLVKLIRQYPADKQKCPIVHCRAGMGRTGTLVVLLIALKLIQEGHITKDNLLQELTRIILAGRYQRGFVFVQSYEQFCIIVRACEYIFNEPDLEPV